MNRNINNQIVTPTCQGELSGLRPGVIATPQQLRNKTCPLTHIIDGAARHGATVEVGSPHNWPVFNERVDVIFLWNGRRQQFAPILASAREIGIPVIFTEFGFFKRATHFHAGTGGILHWSDWSNLLAEEVRTPSTVESRNRLIDVAGPIRYRGASKAGDILVIGQVPGDSQLGDSEIASPQALCQIVKANLPKGAKAVFRGHPKAAFTVNQLAMRILPRCPIHDLTPALQACRFVVTVNSNTAHEALALGIPVLAFGPAVFLKGGVARRATAATLATDFTAMLDGWQPDPDHVLRYLELIAGRQWSLDEFAEGSCVVNLVREVV